ncbi:MAG: extracellular solute-binding protein [Candidatus Campbellbacteria bacterium]|nr:extracellular solute-binding protein [Candidatus Campbellbacteria bacterium]
MKTNFSQGLIVQYVLLGIFAAVAVGFVAFISLYRGSSDSASGLDLTGFTIWGTLPQEHVLPVLNKLIEQDTSYENIAYFERDPITFIDEFVNAVASGRGPDLVLLSHESIIREYDKLISIPYSYFPQSEYRNSYFEVADVLIAPEGILAIPFATDPIILFYNKETQKSIFRADIPNSWEDIAIKITPAATIKNGSVITASGIALGSFNNISYAKDIISTLLLQAGIPIVYRTENGSFVSSLQPFGSQESVLSPANVVFRFYTEFSNPNKSVYSWNNSLRDDRELFLSGKLFLYLAPASEYEILTRANPNLNFGTSIIPQPKGAPSPKTFARLYAFAIPRSARDSALSISVANILSDVNVIAQTNPILPPPHRALFSSYPDSEFGNTVYRSVLISDTWHDPSFRETEIIFRNAILSIISGRESTRNAIEGIQQNIEAIILRREEASQQ